ncbi:MAG: DUF6291 domain-containing protein, partial [Eubacteriales bacterium]|nr:DUF6291 domain-containing protein [Eubacteriales bacterium]
MADKKSFIMYTEWKDFFLSLPVEKAGEMIQAVFRYEDDQEVIFDDLMMSAMFSLLKNRLDENSRKYEEKTERIKKARAVNPKNAHQELKSDNQELKS